MGHHVSRSKVGVILRQLGIWELSLRNVNIVEANELQDALDKDLIEDILLIISYAADTAALAVMKRRPSLIPLVCCAAMADCKHQGENAASPSLSTSHRDRNAARSQLSAKQRSDL